MARGVPITVHVPSPLRACVAGAPEVPIEVPIGAASVRDALGEIERRYPDLYRGVCDETGRVRRHVNVFINDTHIRDREGIDTPLAPGDALIVLPSVSGG